MIYLSQFIDFAATSKGIAVMLLVFVIAAAPLVILRPKVSGTDAKFRNKRHKKWFFGFGLTWFIICIALLVTTLIVVQKKADRPSEPTRKEKRKERREQRRNQVDLTFYDYESACIPKGRHNRLRLPKRAKEIDMYFRFTEDSKYNHGNENQLDFNKLIGRKKCLVRPHRNSDMVGWRYNPDKDQFELLAYRHINNEVFFSRITPTPSILTSGLGLELPKQVTSTLVKTTKIITYMNGNEHGSSLTGLADRKELLKKYA